MCSSSTCPGAADLQLMSLVCSSVLVVSSMWSGNIFSIKMTWDARAPPLPHLFIHHRWDPFCLWNVISGGSFSHTHTHLTAATVWRHVFHVGWKDPGSSWWRTTRDSAMRMNMSTPKSSQRVWRNWKVNLFCFCCCLWYQVLGVQFQDTESLMNFKLSFVTVNQLLQSEELTYSGCRLHEHLITKIMTSYNWQLCAQLELSVYI